ncbi:MAG: hypothetical protein IKJ70_05230 [Clostridia bacterium]|nr:hypothetical protein [Clostridia bacterium]
MLTKRQKLFSDISLGIVGFYFAINLLMFSYCIIDFPDLKIFELIYLLIDKILFPIDLFTWHVFGIFAVISFFVKLGYIGSNKKERIKELIHFIMTGAIAFFIFYIFESSF